MDTQRIGSIVRQILAVLGIVFGILTQSVAALHLPPAVSSVLAGAGSVLLIAEHYLSDPSTGNSQPTVTLPATNTVPPPVVPPTPPSVP